LARSLLTRTQGRLDGEPATMLLRGVLHLEDGNATLAIETLAPLVRQQPDNGTARALLGRAYYLASDFPSAATVLAPLVAQRDADPYVLTLGARAQEAMGDRIMADDMLARALWPERPSADPFASADDAMLARVAPSDVAAARENIPYIRALLSTGQAQQAVARARQLSQANPGAPDAYVIWGDALGAAGRPGEAVKAYEMAANLRFSRDIALRLAAALQRAGDPARSLQVVRLFLSQNPDDVQGQRLAASGYMVQGQWREALRMLKAVEARIGPNDAFLMADMARASLETGDTDKARVYAAFAYRLMPASPITADAYGWTLFRTGTNRRAAVDLLEKAVALAPDHPQLRAHLEQAYAGAGQDRIAAR
ncbi:MAG: tetratricopeptide repeat protein, partial [Sphingobium sp.]